MLDINEIIEDSYDNLDEDGYRTYFNDDSEENGEYKNPEGDMEEEPWDNNQDNDGEMTDWDRYRLNKSYEGKFDLAWAYQLISDQSASNKMEAVRYATFYAKARNVEAQNFIISIMNLNETWGNEKDEYVKEYEEVIELAKTAFALFFRNYVRTQCTEYYSRKAFSFANEYEKVERIKDAVAECFTMIYKEIKRYDSSKGRLTTYFKNPILGCISTYEAKRRGRASKETLAVDKEVSEIEVDLKRRGINPTPQRIALESKSTLEKVRNSVSRIEAENTMLSVESDETKTGICNKVSQGRFDMPEESAIKTEIKDELLKKIYGLSDVEREVLLRMNNMTIKEDQIMDVLETEIGDIYDVARAMNMKSGDVKRIYSNVILKMKSEYGAKIGNDKLLEGRGFIFASTEKDEEVESLLEEITAIF